MGQTAPGRSRPTVDPDANLVEALRRQEPGATEALIAVYGDRAYRLAMRITGNHSDAEEAVQDAFWSVVQRIETFRGDAAFGSWLYRITANSAYTKLRVRRARQHESLWDEISLMVDEDPRSMHDWSEHPEDPALQLELRRVLAAALDTLPDNYRAIVLLRDVEGLSPQPISQITGLSVAAVKTRTHRARLRLRKWLSEYFSDRPLSPRRHLQCLRPRAGAPLPSNHRDRFTSVTVSRPFTTTAVAGPRHEQFEPRNRSSIVCVKPTE